MPDPPNHEPICLRDTDLVREYPVRGTRQPARLESSPEHRAVVLTGRIWDADLEPHLAELARPLHRGSSPRFSR